MGIWHGEQALTSGEVAYVHASRTSRPLPEWLRLKILSYERCAPQQ